MPPAPGNADITHQMCYAAHTKLCSECLDVMLAVTLNIREVLLKRGSQDSSECSLVALSPS